MLSRNHQQRFGRRVAAVLFAGALLAPVSAPAAPSLAARAYIYGLAPLEEQRVIDNFPANTLINVTQLSTPAQRLVVAPNVDTLYTTARLDLSKGPVVLHVPDEHGRYYTMQMLDAYTNSFAYVGRRVSGTRAGDWALLPPGWHGTLPAGVRRIPSPTRTVWMLGRTVVLGDADLPNAQAVQTGYALSRPDGTKLPTLSLPRSSLMPKPLPQGIDFFTSLAGTLTQDPPAPGQQGPLAAFRSLGIGTPTPSPALSGAAAAGQRAIDAYAAGIRSRSVRRHNGWLVPPSGTGNFGRNYLLRAYVAENTLAANVPAEAIYPFAFSDRRGRELSGAHRYRVHFKPGQLPPVDAFWSLTMYDQSIFLVPNAIGRYAVSDRTAGLQRGRDGSLDVYLQSTAPTAPAQRANWLPAPAGVFEVALRLYQPKRRVLAGRWPLPTITRLG